MFSDVLFSGLIVIMTVAMSFGFNIAFGPKNPNYETFLGSVFSILDAAVGNLDLEGLATNNGGLGYVAYTLTAIPIAVVMMNIFIAVVSEVYAEVRENIILLCAVPVSCLIVMIVELSRCLQRTVFSGKTR
jgi:hypothetical protein